MSREIEQIEISKVISHQTEPRLTAPVVKGLYNLYLTSGCLNSLATLIGSMPTETREPLIHTLGSHVTKEKPMFVYAVNMASGTDKSSSTLLAASIDMLWALSLIVDDIEDNDTVRSGQESAWTKFGKSEALRTVQSGLVSIKMCLEDEFGDEGWRIMDSYILKALEAVSQHKHIDLEVQTSVLIQNYIDRNDFYCAAPVEIVQLRRPTILAALEISALRKVTRAGQVLNDLKDLYSQYAHIRPNFSDIRNRLVTIPLKMMYDNFSQNQRLEFLSLWKADHDDPKITDQISILVRDSQVKGVVLDEIRKMYIESLDEFSTVGLEHEFSQVINEWVVYKLAQCSSLA
jgi:geranylgeranyl pyrophosphate synthase